MFSVLKELVFRSFQLLRSQDNYWTSVINRKYNLSIIDANRDDLRILNTIYKGNSYTLYTREEIRQELLDLVFSYCKRVEAESDNLQQSWSLYQQGYKINARTKEGAILQIKEIYKSNDVDIILRNRPLDFFEFSCVEMARRDYRCMEKIKNLNDKIIKGSLPKSIHFELMSHYAKGGCIAPEAEKNLIREIITWLGEAFE